MIRCTLFGPFKMYLLRDGILWLGLDFIEYLIPLEFYSNRVEQFCIVPLELDICCSSKFHNFCIICMISQFSIHTHYLVIKRSSSGCLVRPRNPICPDWDAGRMEETRLVF
jgi:hypothetical protein